MAHWKKFMNKEFLGVWDLPESGKMEIVFSSFENKEIKDQNGNPQTVFIGNNDKKPMILNKTNCALLERLFSSPNIENWTGKPVIITSKKVRAFGTTTDALRFSMDKPRTQPEKKTQPKADLKAEIWELAKQLPADRQQDIIAKVKDAKGNELVYKAILNSIKPEGKLKQSG